MPKGDPPKYPEIRLTGCQIKSVQIARKVAGALDTIEKFAGIRETEIKFVDCFICPDITEEELDGLNKTAMERGVRAVIRQLRK